ncbi:hypothetical protein IFM89_001007 [Coptis chinensis]|uniref:Response regulatory domain-containing protein n=1 Tax=Coptis chinensis TaxID=261450 RepID=A0A835IKZ4_9MAGN|nr:hypothetical protein IFM89_001007 [Coptis chinensis]
MSSAATRILVIDDDNITSKILEKMLIKQQYEVTTCTRASDALDILRARRNDFDIVLSDIEMPGMNGFELLETIVNEFNELPVVLMSSLDDEGSISKGFSKGAREYLIKPVQKDDIKNLWQHVQKTGN